MGKLYDGCCQITEHIESRGLDVFKTRGAIAMKTGFLITLIGPNEPDDPQKIEALKSAARDVLDLELNI